MGKWIAFPHREGLCSRQAHADFPADAPYEREAGRDGFFGPSSHFHHRHPPTGWHSWEGPLRPRAYDLAALSERALMPYEGFVLFTSASARVRYWQCQSAMPRLYRNADGDELLFVHQGAGQLFCDYGRLDYRDGDYLLIPRGTLWRIEPADDSSFYMIESRDSPFQLPERGLLGAQAQFDEALLEVPAIDAGFIAQQDETPWRVDIERAGQISQVGFPYNPLDALGWHGSLSVVRLNWRDIRPVVSPRYHLPPSVHATFVSARLMVSTFVPRPLESDPGALKLPFYHNNDDFDELLFYHAGQFMSRDHIHPGMLSFHPAGFAHGPHPAAWRAAQAGARSHTNEVAVMLDSRDALTPSTDLGSLEWAGYVDSWKDAP